LLFLSILKRRKEYLSNACRHARAVFAGFETFDEFLNFQKQIEKGISIPDRAPCTPIMSREGSPDNHFYDDQKKFHVCLPTKTGS